MNLLKTTIRIAAKDAENAENAEDAEERKDQLRCRCFQWVTRLVSVPTHFFSAFSASSASSAVPLVAFRKKPSLCRASVLLIVLWALFLLSAAVLAWAKIVQQDVLVSGRENRDVEARAMAHSGLALALHPLVTQKTPLLEEQFADDMSFRVKMVSEGGKLNLNWLIAGEEPRKLELLKQWLRQMDLDFKEAEIFVDCLLDFTDGDDVKRLNGMEDKDDYHPPNRPLVSLDELTQVANSKLLTSKPGWREQLTIHSQGPIDLAAADENILRLIPGIGEARMQRFLQYRRGKDGVDGTIDDPEFKSVQELFSFLGLSQKQGQDIGGLIGFKDPTMHITSEGTSAKVVRQVEVIAIKGGSNPVIRYWKE